jgi:hypothetical protein
MDKRDIVRRTQEAAHRSAAHVPVDTQRSWYAKDLNAIGRNKPPVFEGQSVNRRIESWGEFFTHPFSILMLALITFGLVFGTLMWREGKLDFLWANKGAIAGHGPKAWMGSGKEKASRAKPGSVSADVEAPPPNEVEAVLDQMRADEAVAAAERRAAAIAASVVPDAPASETPAN